MIHAKSKRCTSQFPNQWLKLSKLCLPSKVSKLVICFAILQLGGCANLGVQPWERALLAKEEMALVGDGIDVGLDDHIYFSKEATSGGRGFAGGGCGCN